MKGLKNKRGISLIVLVITIIVMIILAAAIILSLNSSDIIGKANEAVTKSDLANAKSVVAIAQGEWELMTPSEQKAEGNFSAYAAKKLREAGFGDKYGATNDGEVVTGAAAVIVSNNVEKGAEVKGYTLTEKTYDTDGTELANSHNDWTDVPQTLKTDTDMVWRYVGLSNAGNILIAPDIPTTVPETSKITLGWENEQLLDTICDELYTTDKGNAVSMDLFDVLNILDYTGPAPQEMSNYELPDCVEEGMSEFYYDYGYDMTLSNASKNINIKYLSLVFFQSEYYLATGYSGAWYYSSFYDTCEWNGFDNEDYICRVNASDIDYVMKSYVDCVDSDISYAIRPIVTLNSNVEMTYDAATKTLTLK